MSFFEVLQSLGGNIWIYGGVFILILGILVFVHEWGHYIVARWCGVKVEVFSIGFGKEIAGFNDKKGTRWKIAMIPLGGYVKLFGDVDPASAGNVENAQGSTQRVLTSAERKVAFFSQPVAKRAAVVIAGPAINYLFAIVVLTALFVFNGQPVTPPSAAAVIGGSSAEKHGFLPHDKVLSIDGTPIVNFEDIRREMMISLDAERHFTVERDGKIVDIYARPEKVEQEDRFGFKHSRGLLGLISPRHAIDIKTIRNIDGKSYEEGDIEAVRRDLLRRLDTTFQIIIANGPEPDTLIINPVSAFNEALGAAKGETENPESGLLFLADQAGNSFVKYAPHIAFIKALEQTWVVTRGTVEALGQIVMGTRSATELGGVIRIGALAGDMAKQGIIALILFMALLSINLGLINMFPIPMLDGGHLLFYAFEAALGRPIPERIQEYAFRAGLVFLVGIMVFANLNDLIQLLL